MQKKRRKQLKRAEREEKEVCKAKKRFMASVERERGGGEGEQSGEEGNGRLGDLMHNGKANKSE